MDAGGASGFCCRSRLGGKALWRTAGTGQQRSISHHVSLACAARRKGFPHFEAGREECPRHCCTASSTGSGSRRKFERGVVASTASLAANDLLLHPSGVLGRSTLSPDGLGPSACPARSTEQARSTQQAMARRVSSSELRRRFSDSSPSAFAAVAALRMVASLRPFTFCMPRTKCAT